MEIDSHFSSISGSCITDGRPEAGDLWAGDYHSKSEWDMKAVWGAGTDLKRIWIGILGCEERGGEGEDSIHWD